MSCFCSFDITGIVLRSLKRKVLLFSNSQNNSCASVSFFVKFADLQLVASLKKMYHVYFSANFSMFSGNFFKDHLRVITFVRSSSQFRSNIFHLSWFFSVSVTTCPIRSRSRGSRMIWFPKCYMRERKCNLVISPLTVFEYYNVSDHRRVWTTILSYAIHFTNPTNLYCQ